MSTLADYAVSQRCDGYDDYFAKRAEMLRGSSARDVARAKTPAIAAFIRKNAEESCSSEDGEADAKEDAKEDEKKDGKKDGKKMPPWLTGGDKEAKAQLGTGTRFKSLVTDLKKKDMKDGKKDIENPYALAAAIGRKAHGKKKFQDMAAKGRAKKSSVEFSHLAYFMEKRAQPAHVGPSAEAGALSGGALGGLGGLVGGGILGGIAGYGRGQETQGLFDNGWRPYGTAALGALLGAAGGGLGGAALGAGSGALMGAGEGLARNVLEQQYGPMSGNVGPHAALGALGGAGLGALTGGAQGALAGSLGGPPGMIAGGLGGSMLGGLSGALGGAGGGALRGATRSVLEKKRSSKSKKGKED